MSPRLLGISHPVRVPDLTGRPPSQLPGARNLAIELYVINDAMAQAVGILPEVAYAGSHA